MNALLLAPLLAQAPKWATYDAKADGFSILMPGKPILSKQSTIGVNTNMYIAQGPPFVGIVSRTALTPSLKASDVAQMKAAMISSMVYTSHSTVTGEKAATYAGVSGKQTNFKTGSGGGGAAWIGQKGRAVYLVAIVKQGGASATEIAKFFNSLRVR